MSVGALYSPGGVAGSFGSNSAMSFGLNYAAGPFGLGAAYTQKKYPGAGNGSPQIPVWNWGVGAHYVWSPAYTAADFATVRNSFSGAGAYAGQVAANWQITPALSFGASHMYMKGNVVLDNNHANRFGATVNYSLLKRTMVYAEGVFQRANLGAQAPINGIMDLEGSSGSASQRLLASACALFSNALQYFASGFHRWDRLIPPNESETSPGRARWHDHAQILPRIAHHIRDLKTTCVLALSESSPVQTKAGNVCWSR
ncbi:porin [Paraburkholderia sp. UCT2]|uniref:porin n=1 Tax=Paraburkholderia sp. UCT2 TaxID=2615208 RepID=UPI00292A57FE|nr:porin [Paraburkholderia sp. UCT2]